MTLVLRTLTGIATLAFSLGACGTANELWPSPETPPAAAIPNTAQRVDEAIRVTATARPAGSAAAENVTPLWLSIENNGRSPVVVDRSSLRLVASDGTVYRALRVTGRPVAITGEQASVHPIPTEPAREQAMPDEPIAPGNRAVGWVYFEQVAPGTQGLDLRAQIEDPSNGSVVTEVNVPFDIAG